MLAVFNFPNLNGYGDVIQRTECCYVKFIDTQMSVCLFLNLYVCLFMYLFISLSLLAGFQGPAAGSCGFFFMCVVEWWALKSGVPALLPSHLLLQSKSVLQGCAPPEGAAGYLVCAESTMLWHSAAGRCTAPRSVCWRHHWCIPAIRPCRLKN